MSLRNLLLRSLVQRSKCTNLAWIAVRDDQKHRDRDRREEWNYFKTGVSAALLGAALVGTNRKDQIENTSKVTQNKQNEAKPTEESKDVIIEAGAKRPDLPTFRAEEVSKHDTTSSFWVTYKQGVYDVTSFLPSHPGGEQILNAAGLSIEPFWNVYGMHRTQQVYDLLESYRIGNLHEDDIVDHSDDELWVREPVRDRRLIVKTAKPFNAEIPPQHQIEHFDTPNDLFYVRQHMPVPELDARTHTLRVTIVGKGVHTTQFTLDQLGQFRRGAVRAALMCAGNRRSEMDKVKAVKGISWSGGAISNAVWSGVYLRDLLVHCGIDTDNVEGKHVIFQGSDVDATGVNFSTSIPLSMALNPSGCILLATHMNGELLPPDHGYPLRVIVPGAPAVRSVKWLESITVSEEESPSHWHQKDYRSFNASTTWESAHFPSAPPLYSLPVTSAICHPQDGDTVKVTDGHVEVKGYAYSGGGAKVMRVDVSGDGGGTWVEADIVRADRAPPQQHYAWTLWAARVPVSPGQKQVEIWAKATDSNFNTQPETFEHIWNIRGILSNAYHRIKVQLEH